MRKSIKSEKLEIIRLGKQAEDLNLRAEILIEEYGTEKAMEMALQWLDDAEQKFFELPMVRIFYSRRYEPEFERDIHKLPDTERKYQEIVLESLQFLKIMRAEHKRNDPIQMLRWMPVIRQGFINASSIADEIEHRKQSAKGGRACKERKWAQAAADWLNEEFPKLKKDSAWEKIPESHGDPLDIESGDDEFRVYRDGDKLIAVSTSLGLDSAGQPKPLKKSTFQKNYFKKRN